MLDEPLEAFASAGRRNGSHVSAPPPRRSLARAGFDIVIVTQRRPSLSQLLLALDTGRGPAPERVMVVDDRPFPADPRGLPRFKNKLRGRVRVLRSQGVGAAIAGNLGWRACSAPWVVFIDDDAVPSNDWLARLHDDLSHLDEKFAGSQGRIHVPHPLPHERNRVGIESLGWLSSDMAYRRRALEALGGFDEWFLHAYRDDAELAVRALRHGYRLSRGRRCAQHRLLGVRVWVAAVAETPRSRDVRLAALHRVRWNRAIAASGGRFPRHLTVTLAGLAALGGALAGSAALAGLGAGVWIAGTAELALAHVPGGRLARGQAAALLASSMLIPPLAVLQRLRGYVQLGWLVLRAQLAQGSWLERLARQSQRWIQRLRALRARGRTHRELAASEGPEAAELAQSLLEEGA